MDFTIGSISPTGRELPKRRDPVPRVKESGSRRERRRKKKDRQNKPREGVVVRLSTSRDRKAPKTDTYPGA